MKRILLFIGLLVAGLTVLTLASGPGGLGGGSGDAGASRPSVKDAGEDTPLNAFATGKGTVPDGIGVSKIEGSTMYLERRPARDGTKLPDMVLKIGELQPSRDGSALLTKPVLVVPSAEGGEPEAILEADSGRGFFAGTPPSPAAGPWRFEKATIRYRDPKGRVGELRLTCPVVEARFEMAGEKASLRSISTEEAFDIDGELVRGSGRGFVFDTVKGEYRILSNPSLELRPGATARLTQLLRLRSKGGATITDGSPRNESTLELLFEDDGVFRQERDGGATFFEVEGNKLFVRLERGAKDRVKGESLEPKAFDATGDVLFRTQAVDGRCAQAFGGFNASHALSDLTLIGPYRAEVKVARDKEVLPGFGAPDVLVFSGPGTVKSTLVDPATETYRFVTEGAARVSFAEPGRKEPATFSADRMEGNYRKSDLTEFRADRNVVFESAQGRAIAEHAELLGADPERSFLLTSPRSVDLTFHGTPAGAKPASGGSKAPLHLTSKKVTFAAVPQAAPGDARRTRLTAEGDVTGSTKDTDGSEITFAARLLETDLGESVERKVTLTDAVSADFKARQLHLEGSYLTIHESPSLDATAAAASMLFRQGELRGAPALLTLGETSQGKRTITSPLIRFTNEHVRAEGPVEVMVPADAFTAGAAARAVAGDIEYVWITGRRLEVKLDNAGRPVDATVFGPLDGRGAYAVTGERLTLDFRQGRHSLLGREGVRATIRRAKKPGAPGFFAESPRMDMEGDSQTLTLQGGGEVVIDGAPTGLQTLGSKEPVKASSDGVLRLTATDSVKITPARVTFLGDVRATGEGKDPWSLDADRLDVDLGETREPVRMSATGTVVFSMPGRLEGSAHALRFSETTKVLELDGTKEAPAVLDFAGGHFEAAWIKCNVQTCLVDAGPGLLSTPKTARQRVRPR